jgi:hypothetical protein
MSLTRFTRFDCTTLFQKHLSKISKDIRDEFGLIFCWSKQDQVSKAFGHPPRQFGKICAFAL